MDWRDIIAKATIDSKRYCTLIHGTSWKSRFNVYYKLEDHLIRVKLNSQFFKVFRDLKKQLFPLRESGFQLVQNALMSAFQPSWDQVRKALDFLEINNKDSKVRIKPWRSIRVLTMRTAMSTYKRSNHTTHIHADELLPLATWGHTWSRL